MNPFKKIFDNITRESIEREAKKLGLKPDDVQLLLHLTPNGQAGYKVCVNYQPKFDITFMKIRNVKIDFLGYNSFVPPFIAKTLAGLSDRYNINPASIYVFVTHSNNNIILWLYNGNKHVKQLLEEDVYSDEQMMEAQQ